MPSLTIQPGQSAALPFKGYDASHNVAPIHGTVVISDYTKAYVKNFTGGIPGPGIVVVPKITAPQGGSFDVSATISSFDANGNPLNPIQFDVTVLGPPAPPPATEVDAGTAAVVPVGNNDYGPNVDPGSGSISFS